MVAELKVFVFSNCEIFRRCTSVIYWDRNAGNSGNTDVCRVCNEVHDGKIGNINLFSVKLFLWKIMPGITVDITRGWEPFHHQKHLSVQSKISWVFFDRNFFTNIMWFYQMRICPKPQNPDSMKYKYSWSVWDSSHTHLLVWMSCFGLFHEFRWAEYGISCQRENMESQQLEASHRMQIHSNHIIVKVCLWWWWWWRRWQSQWWRW